MLSILGRNGAARGGVRAARFYSPVRSRVPEPPRPRLSKRGPGLSDHGDIAAPSIDGAQAAALTGAPRSPVPTVPVPAVLLSLLSEPVLIFERHIEFMNVIAGFEQANRYTIYNSAGQVLGFMEEDDLSITKAILRQVYKLHRPFTVNVFDSNGQHALTIHRPFSFINSRIKCFFPGASRQNNAACIGESRQEWHLWRRRYNLYLNNAAKDEMAQFGRVDAPFLSFSFPVDNEQQKVIGAIDRNWVGLAREMFTDTGVYVLRMSPQSLAEVGYHSAVPDLSIEQRAVMLATAVSIDFDYFSRHSSRGVGLSDVE